MQSTCVLFWICLAAAVIEVTYAQSIHVVMVGDTGSFYDPQVTTARKGDMVSFQWTGMFHSVTQSSFENPCTPLPGGFDSGITGNPQQMLILPEWNLTITDDTQPIYFFCKVTVPVPHCTNGMVGAINAQLTGVNNSFNNFSQNAKSLTNVPTLPVASPVLTGVGAVATATPIAVNNVSSVTSNSSSSTSTSSTLSAPTNTSALVPAPTSQAASSSGLSSGVKGGIAGGTVGGVLLVVLLVLLLISYNRGRRYRKQAQASKTLRSQDMSHVDRQDLIYISPEDPPPVVTHAPQRHLRSQGSLSVADSMERESSGPSINLKELAVEIAKNIRQEIGIQDRTEHGVLTSVPEQAIMNAVTRSDSTRFGGGDTVQRAESGRAESARSTEASRGTESTRSGRQLPIPPQKRADVYSVDTLPEYVPGQSR